MQTNLLKGPEFLIKFQALVYGLNALGPTNTVWSVWFEQATNITQFLYIIQSTVTLSLNALVSSHALTKAFIMYL